MSAGAQGKENAANIKVGDRILVKHYTMENEADRATLEWLGKERALGISRTKTGEGVTVARVLAVEAVMVNGGRRAKRVYNIMTTEGVLENNAPIQTMWLAPEDKAGINRAHKEALASNEVMDAYPVAEEVTEVPAEDEATAARHADSRAYHRELAAKVRVAPAVKEAPMAGEGGSMPFIGRAPVAPGQLTRAEILEARRAAREAARAAEVDALRAEFNAQPWNAGRRLAIRLRLAQLSATVYPDRFETQDEYEVDVLRARYVSTNHPEARERIVARLAALGAVVYPEGSPEYTTYREALKTALADPRAWDFLDV